MYIDYFNAVKTLIKSNLNEVKTVDWYNNQYERYADLKAVKLPAVYIEFDDPMEWKTMGNGVQSSIARINFHLVINDVADGPEKSMLIATKLHKLLHLSVLMNLNEQLSSQLMRVTSSLNTTYDQLKIIILTYETELYDCSAVKEKTEVAVSFNLSQNP